MRFYIWFNGGVQAAWREVPVDNALDCTEMSDEEFGRAVDSLICREVGFGVRELQTQAQQNDI